MAGDVNQFGGSMALNFLGWRTDTQKFDLPKAVGLQGMLLGAGISYACSKVGLNRYLPIKL